MPQPQERARPNEEYRQQAAQRMTFVSGPQSQVTVDGRDPTPLAAPAPQAEPNWEERYRAAELKIHEQSGRMAALEQTVNAVTTRQERQTQSTTMPSAAPAPRAAAPAAGSWEEFLSNEQGGQTVQQLPNQGGQAPAGFVRQDEVETLARNIANQQISRTLQGIDANNRKGDELFNRFNTEAADIHHLSGTVKTFYDTALKTGATPDQSYEYATAQVRALRDSGELPVQARQPQQQQGQNGLQVYRPQQRAGQWAMPAPPAQNQQQGNGGYGSGGQMNHGWNQTAPQQQGVEYGNDFLAGELSSWADERKAIQQKRKAG